MAENEMNTDQGQELHDILEKIQETESLIFDQLGTLGVDVDTYTEGSRTIDGLYKLICKIESIKMAE